MHSADRVNISLSQSIRNHYGNETKKLIKSYGKALHKRARWRNHHIFSMRCRDEGVIPSSLRIKPPVRTREGYQIAAKASKAFLSARIRQSYKEKSRLNEMCDSISTKLQKTMEEEDFRKVETLCKKASDKTHARTRSMHVRKLETLVTKKNTKSDISLRPQGLEKWVVTKTDVELTQDQESVLRLGLNFAPVPKKLPIIDTVSAVEEGARGLAEVDANDLRGRVCGVLRKARLPRHNLTIKQRKALKSLKDLDGVVILPADKGNATVLMNEEEYQSKLAKMLDSDTYKVLKKDPTKTQENKIGSILKDIARTGEIPTKLYFRLKPSGCKPPMLYGLPKIRLGKRLPFYTVWVTSEVAGKLYCFMNTF